MIADGLAPIHAPAAEDTNGGHGTAPANPDLPPRQFPHPLTVYFVTLAVAICPWVVQLVLELVRSEERGAITVRLLSDIVTTATLKIAQTGEPALVGMLLVLATVVNFHVVVLPFASVARRNAEFVVNGASIILVALCAGVWGGIRMNLDADPQALRPLNDQLVMVVTVGLWIVCAVTSGLSVAITSRGAEP